MKKIFLTIAFIATGLVASAQVGIGNTDPKVSLHVTGTNDNGAVTGVDGVLVPRVNNANMATATAGTEDGQLVYNTVSKAFFYWNAATPAWTQVGGGTDTSIYANDGQLAAARTVDQNNNNLTFNTGTARAIVNGSFQTAGAVYANVRLTNANPLVPGTWNATDYVLVMTAAATGQFELPDATLNSGRILVLHNATGGVRTWKTGQVEGAGRFHPVNNTSIASGRATTVISNGSIWYSLN